MELFGFMKSLKRIKVGNFKIQDAINLEDLNENSKTILISELFKDFPMVFLNENKERLFLNGVKLNCNLSDGPCSVYSENKEYIGIGVVKDKTLKRDVIIRENS